MSSLWNETDGTDWDNLKPRDIRHTERLKHLASLNVSFEAHRSTFSPAIVIDEVDGVAQEESRLTDVFCTSCRQEYTRV